MSKICDMEGVRGGDTGFPVELVFEEESQRIMVRAINEGGYACTETDLFDLIAWLHNVAPEGVRIDAVINAIIAFAARQRSD
jgi:hypothetical protein